MNLECLWRDIYTRDGVVYEGYESCYCTPCLVGGDFRSPTVQTCTYDIHIYRIKVQQVALIILESESVGAVL